MDGGVERSERASAGTIARALQCLPSCLLFGLVALALVSAAGCLLVGDFTDSFGILLAGAISLTVAGGLTIVGSFFPGFIVAVIAIDALDGGLEGRPDEYMDGRSSPVVGALGILMLIGAAIWFAVLLF
jgi:hypothetical protein